MKDYDETKIRSYGPGKFVTILDSYVYQSSLDGGCDAEEGNVGLGESWFGAIVFRDGDTTFDEYDLNQDERNKLRSSAGVIIQEDNQGFVDVRYYDTAVEMDEDWNWNEMLVEEEDEPETW